MRVKYFFSFFNENVFKSQFRGSEKGTVCSIKIYIYFLYEDIMVTKFHEKQFLFALNDD